MNVQTCWQVDVVTAVKLRIRILMAHIIVQGESILRVLDGQSTRSSECCTAKDGLGNVFLNLVTFTLDLDLNLPQYTHGLPLPSEKHRFLWNDAPIQP